MFTHRRHMLPDSLVESGSASFMGMNIRAVWGVVVGDILSIEMYEYNG